MIAGEAKLLPEEVIDEIIARHPDKTGDVLSVFEEIQERHPLKYLPEATHDYVVRKTGVSRSQIPPRISMNTWLSADIMPTTRPHKNRTPTRPSKK